MSTLPIPLCRTMLRISTRQGVPSQRPSVRARISRPYSSDASRAAGAQKQQAAATAASPSTAAKSSAQAAVEAPAQPAATPVAFWQRLGPVSSALNAYGRAHRRRPYWTQFFGALGVYFLGDLSAQGIGGDDYDPKRTARMITIGGAAAIPVYKWFMFLEHHFNYASRARSLATKIVVNQVAFTPVISCFFFGMQSILAGGSPADAWERIRNTVPISYRNALLVGPLVTLVNFAFIPLHFRALFSGAFAVAWQTYLSWLNRYAEKGTDKHQHERTQQRSQTEVATARA